LFVALIKDKVSSSTSDEDRADWVHILEVMSGGAQWGGAAGDHTDMPDVQQGVRLAEHVRQRREAAELLQAEERARHLPQLLAAARQAAIAKWPETRARLAARWAVPEVRLDINEPKYSSEAMLAQLRAASEGSGAAV
jgi:hypothetical protein